MTYSPTLSYGLAAYYLLTAFIIAIIWMIIARKEYEYNKNFPKIFGLSMFPLLGWAFGLFLMMIIFNYIEHIFFLKRFAIQLLVFLAVYWILLLTAETIGYHVFHIHNEHGAQYGGIPILDVIHAVWWMKIAYFALGPIMFITCKIIGI